MRTLYELLDQIAEQCCSTLVPPGEAARIANTDALPPSELVAVIGFSGDAVRGAIGLCATVEALASSHPATLAGEAVGPGAIEDWLAESTNQLLGRLKAQLHRYGVSLWMGTPIVLRGVALSVVGPGSTARRYALTLGSGEVYTFWLDVEAVDGLRVLEPPDGALLGPQPGDLLLF